MKQRSALCRKIYRLEQEIKKLTLENSQLMAQQENNLPKILK